MQDKVNPINKKWEFDEEVTKVFDDMLERSIPNYHTMRDLTFEIGKKYVQKDTSIIDLGCSLGESLVPFLKLNNELVGIEISKPMYEAAKKRFKGCSSVKILNDDITVNFPKNIKSSLILSVLTLQFTPIEYRYKILSDCYESLVDGGALILIEKVLGNGADIDDKLVETYYEMKAKNNYTYEQIQNKKKSLEGVLVPVTSKWNEDLLKKTGFKDVECFWRCLNFSGWVAVK